MRVIKNKIKIDKSMKLLKQGELLIAGFTQSMMKKPEQFSLGQFPVYLEYGEGALVRDVDGNEFIDYICGLGANTLGHNHPRVVDAIHQNLVKGIIHSLPAPVELTTAKTLVDMIPSAEMVRFFKTGADANSAAIRLARFLTKKEEIITVGYNGWHDHYMFDTPGVPKIVGDYTHRMPLFSPEDEQPLINLIEQKGTQLAALILSVPYNRELSAEFVQRLQRTCNNHDVLFILDEVVTGFRLALGGAQEYFGVKADLATFSKGIAAGMPLSAVTGSRKLMSEMEQLQVSTTFGGEMLSLEVCNAVLREYQSTNYIEHVNALGESLKSSINAISEEIGSPLRVVGYNSIPMFLFSQNPSEHAKYAVPFLAQMALRGVLLRRDVNFISAAHSQTQIDLTVQAVHDSLLAMKELQLLDTV